MIIGTFRKLGENYVGRLQTLTVDIELAIAPAPPTNAENAPDWRVYLGEHGAEVGAGWNRVGDVAGPFISVRIDDPALAGPLHANLIHSGLKDDERHLLWSRLPLRESN